MSSKTAGQAPTGHLVDAQAEATVDLRTAAKVLGVHYQTAYRWVRTGRLHARLVGGRYVVRASDIADVDRDRRTPSAPRPPRRSTIEHAASRMHEALLAGDEPAAERIVHRLTDEGAATIDVIRLVVVPPLEQIGRAWHAGDLNISTEHRASAIVERLLAGLNPNPRGRRRGVVVVAALSGDHHSLPTAMAAVVLRADHWHVHHLGADLPPDELLGFCRQHDVDVAIITVTIAETRSSAETTADALRASGTPTIVGGRGDDLTELIERTRRAGREAAETHRR